MSKELRPLTSTLCKQRHQEYVDYIERNVLTKQSEVDTSVIAKDSDEFYGKLSIFGGQRQEKRDSSRNICQSQASFWEVGMYNTDGQKTQITSRIRVKDLTLVTPNAELYFNTFNDSCIFVIRQYDENKAFISSIGIVNNGQKIKMAENVNYLSVTIFNSNNDVPGEADNILNKIKSGEIKPFICLSSEENKDFEDYGVKPSMYDPSEIEAVGGEKAELELGTILSTNGTNGDNNTRVRIKDYVKVVANTECTIDAENVEEVVVFEYDKDKKYLFRVGWEKIPYTFNLSENTRYIRYIFRKKDNSVLTVDSVKDKSKHLRSVEITTSNKNMYDESKITEGILISVTGTSSNNSHFNLSDFIKVRTSTTYTFSRDESEKAESQFLVLEYDVQKNFIKRQGNVRNNTNKLTFTTGENTKFVRLQYRVDYAYTDLQFEEEESRTDYIKHCGQTLTMPIQRKMFEGDTFEKIDGVWYEKHTWLELVLDKEKINKLTEQNTDTTGMYRYLYKLTENVSITDKTHAQGYCTHYSMTASSGTYKKEKGFAVSRSTSDKKMYLCIYDEGETLEEFKTKIANKEIKFYLQSEEPLLLKCTAEQSAILDKIDTYKNGTIITTDNDLCKISLRYKEDYDKRITALEKQINTATEVAESE